MTIGSANSGMTFDHLVGPSQQRFRNCHPEGVRGLEVDRRFELRRLLYRNVGNLDAAEELDDLSGQKFANDLNEARSKAGKTALFRRFRPLIDGG